jgi:hypothetical protein
MSDYNLNEEYLTLLADYLENLPENYGQFNMSRFNTAQYKDKNCFPVDVLVPENFCGTAGCAIGHAPFVKGLPPPDENDNWGEYSLEITYEDGLCHTDEQDRLWDFMFGGFWSDFDNTPHGAAKRIRLALTKPELCLELMEEYDGGYDIIESYENLLLEL